MSAPPVFAEVNFQQLGVLRDVLDLIGRLRQIQDPITSPVGLRQTIELVLRFAELLGVAADFTNRLRQILADDNVFQIVLAIVRFLFGVATVEAQEGRVVVTLANGSQTKVDAKDFLDWVRIVIEIINLLRRIRGGETQIGV